MNRKQEIAVGARAGGNSADKTDVAAYGAITGLLKHCDSNNLLKKWRNAYPNYFERLRRREAAKAAIAQQRKEELAALLERTKRTGEPGGRLERAMECGLRAASMAE